MNRIQCSLGAVAMLFACPLFATENTKTGVTTMHDFEMKSIDGETIKLAKYKDHLCMVVNVASK